jgi:predicted ATP-grasp superfamily ATP-dependent carboligase
LTPIQYCPSKKFGEVLVDVIADYNEFSLMFIYQPDFVMKSSTPHVLDIGMFW